jgi:hypothetical protein
MLVVRHKENQYTETGLSTPFRPAVLNLAPMLCVGAFFISDNPFSERTPLFLALGPDQ